ncbi:MAG: hypothetical protein Q9180_007771, partial [Flavoplaca navasiana]
RLATLGQIPHGCWGEFCETSNKERPKEHTAFASQSIERCLILVPFDMTGSGIVALS